MNTNNTKLQINVPEELKQKLKAEAALQGKTLTNYITELLQKAIAKK